MEFIKRHFELESRRGELEIDLYADTHFGSKSVDEDLLKRHIKETKEQNRYWAFLGDAVDGILPGDRRFRALGLTDWAWDALQGERLIQAQWERFTDLFMPIADRCLFILDGDGKHNSSNGIADCMRDAVTALGIVDENKKPKIYQTVYYNAICDRQGGTKTTIPLVFHHGWFAGRKSGSKINNLVDSLNFFPEAWGFFCGHGHTKVVTPPLVGIVERAGKGQSLYRRAAMTGSYLRTYSEDTVGYGEVKLYPPVALGRITVVLRPYMVDDQKRMEITNQ